MFAVKNCSLNVLKLLSDNITRYLPYLELEVKLSEFTLKICVKKSFEKININMKYANTVNNEITFMLEIGDFKFLQCIHGIKF